MTPSQILNMPQVKSDLEVLQPQSCVQKFEESISLFFILTSLNIPLTHSLAFKFVKYSESGLGEP